MLGLLFFITTIIFAVLYIKKINGESNIDYSSQSYRQGYWDGVRAAEQGAHSPESSPPPMQMPQAPPQSFAPSPQVNASYPTQPPGVEFMQPNAGQYAPQMTLPQNYQYQYASPQNYAMPPQAPSRSASNVTINIALYVAMLLLVSGIISLTMTFSAMTWLNVAMIWLWIFVMYVTGFVLEKRVPMVKPAALAFVGTALASVPLAGIVTYSVLGGYAAACWFGSSLVGFGLYIYATLRFKNQFLAYISMLALLTTSLSLPALASASLAWYYVAMIAFGAATALFAQLKLSWLPKILSQPTAVSSAIAVPSALFAALVSFSALSIAEYTAILATGLLYYAAQALTLKSVGQKIYADLMARLLSLVVVGTAVAWLGENSMDAVSLVLSGVALLHVLVAAQFVPRGRPSASVNETMVWVGFFVAGIVSPLFAIGDNYQIIWIIEMVLLALASVFVAIRTRRYSLLWALFYALLNLPWLISSQAGFSNEATIVMYSVLANVTLALRLFIRKLSAVSATLIYVSVGVWLLAAAIFMLGLTSLLWPAFWFALVAAALYFVAIVEKLRVFAAFAHGALLTAAEIAIYWWTSYAFATFMVAGALNLVLAAGIAEVCSARFAASRTAKTLRYSMIPYAAIIGAATLASSDYESQLAVAWISAVLAIAYAAYRLRHVVLIYLAQVTIILQILLSFLAYSLGWEPLAALLAWLPLLGFGVVSASASLLLKRRSPATESWWHTGVASALLFGSLSLLTLESSDYAWRSCAWLAAVTAAYLIAYLTRQISMLYVANSAAVILVVLVSAWAKLSGDATLVLISWLGLAGFYGVAWIYRVLRGRSRVWFAMMISGIITAISAGMFALFSSDLLVISAATVVLFGTAAASIFSDYEAKKVQLNPTGTFFAVAAVQRLLSLVFPDLHFLIFSHIWAAWFLAYYAVFSLTKQRSRATLSLVVSLLVLTVPCLFEAIISGGWYQLLFLVEQVAIVIAGLISSRKLSTIWGAVGVTLAALYMMRGFQALLSITVGLLVIAAVIYVIVRANKKGKNHQGPQIPPNA